MQIRPTATPTTCCEFSTLNPPAHSFTQVTLFPACTLFLCRTYSAISSSQQRQSYKQEFNQDYSEYRLLHARIDGVTQQFMELNTQLQQLSRESCKYKVRRHACVCLEVIPSV